jgi:hypothetical protein
MRFDRPVLAKILPLCLTVLVLLAAPSTYGATGATVTYRKVFKSSYPEFVEIKVTESGTATADIRQLDEEPSPEAFEINRPILEKIFQLTAQLHNFEGLNLEVHRRIANLGDKTFKYEKNGEVHEVHFNFTLDSSASQLLDVFEGLTREQSDLSNLERAMRYDRLGVNDVLQRIEVAYNNKLYPEPDRFLSAFDQLAADEKFLDIARQRARTLAGRIRNAH